MTGKECKDFIKANQTVHKVEDHWSYEDLIKFGFRPVNKTAMGFVRTYKYVNKDGAEIEATTGSSGDYWRDNTHGGGGWWSSMLSHLRENYSKN